MSDSPRRVVILDLYCPQAYDAETLKEQALGGTEATVARVAEGLAATGRYEVIVAQHNRKGAHCRGKATYCSVDDLATLPKDPDFLVCLRTPQGIPWLRSRWSDSRLFLWCHDENYAELVAHHDMLAQARASLLAVSRYHKQGIQDAFLSQSSRFPGVTVDYVYNPVSDSLVPDEGAPWSPDSFVFFSSPHKGLELTLKQWEHIRRALPKATLHIANPGYYERGIAEQAGVCIAGKLAHPDVIRLVRGAAAVLHLNPDYPESFGIVHAEANAIGTPVLTSGIGANREVLCPYREQIVNVKSTEDVVKRLLSWREIGRPAVSCRPEFRQSAVIKRWQEILR
jgi:glycosyltransferase involved in cell wall biosynthesis